MRVTIDFDTDDFSSDLGDAQAVAVNALLALTDVVADTDRAALPRPGRGEECSLSLDADGASVHVGSLSTSGRASAVERVIAAGQSAEDARRAALGQEATR